MASGFPLGLGGVNVGEHEIDIAGLTASFCTSFGYILVGLSVFRITCLASVAGFPAAWRTGDLDLGRDQARESR